MSTEALCPWHFSRDEINSVLNYCHPVPASRGFGQAYVAKHHPEWEFNELVRIFHAAGIVVLRGSGTPICQQNVKRLRTNKVLWFVDYEPDRVAVTEPYGPQNSGDDELTARMRFHQSWWRHHRLGVPWSDDKRAKHGNYLTASDGNAGKNFLTPAIHWCANERIAAGGGVEEFRCTRNLLSSQPMAFNLFGPLHHDPDLAAVLLDPLLPGGARSAAVFVEWAPPRKLHLDDATSFDVAVRYTTRDGVPALAGIETKLTEPFSQKTYGLDDEHSERYRAVARRSKVWLDPHDAALTDKRWNQIWRNHLLVESIRQHEPGLLGNEIVVHHPLDTRCATNINSYRAFLSDPATLGAFTLEDIVTTWKPLLNTAGQRRWLRDFTDRYLNLELSQAAWAERADNR